MLKKSKSAGRVTTDRASTLAEALRPVITRALSDPELHTALRHAFDTGRVLSDEVLGQKPRAAARRLAEDKKLRRRLQASAIELRDAFEHVSEPPAKRRGRSLLKLLLAAGAAAGAFYLAKKRGDGSGDDFS